MGRRNLKQSYLLAVIALFILYYLNLVFEIARIETSFVSGWLLFFTIFVLTVYGLKRFLLPFSRYHMSFWRKFHIFIGAFSILFFMFHLKFMFPTGFFESCLAFLFLVVAFTGVFGVFLQKSIPKKLSINGNEFLYEEIPQHRLKLIKEFEALITSSAQSKSMLSSELLEKIYAYIANNKNLLTLYSTQNVPLKRELTSLSNSDAKIIASEILKLIEEKNRLEYSYTNQFILKNWNLLHTPLIGALILFTALHVFLVYSFRP